MKKKLIGLLVFLIAMVGVMYFMGVFDKTKATPEEIEAGKKDGDELLDTTNSVYDDIDMSDFDEDTTELDLGLDEEEFDAESML
mgnify:FL=1|jgi:hypothetical protein